MQLHQRNLALPAPARLTRRKVKRAEILNPMPLVFHRFIALLLFGLLGTFVGPDLLAEESKSGPATLSDGPYVRWQGRQATVLSVHDGIRHEYRLTEPFELDLPGLTPIRLDPASPAAAVSDISAPDRIAAVSDVHGNFRGLVALLQAHHIIDAQKNWSFAHNHLVIIGDIFDRGSQVTEVLWLLRQLEAQAQSAGGRVHVLLGNHEIAALRGDERYLHPNYVFLQKKVLGTDQKALYGPATEMGRWLRSRPVLLRIGSFLFAHGGPSPAMLPEEREIEAFNDAFRKVIDLEGSQRLLGRDSPIWYRGLIPGKESKRPDASTEEIEQILWAFGVRTIVVGHSTIRRGISTFHSGRVHGIDADLQSGGTGEIWLFRNGACFRGQSDGSSSPLALF